MKRAEDFRSAFGPADSAFENAVSHTLQELRLQEERRPAFRRPRVLVPVIAALLVLMLGIGIAVWVQIMFLNGNMVVMTGEKMQISAAQTVPKQSITAVRTTSSFFIFISPPMIAVSYGSMILNMKFFLLERHLKN